jgi:Flp pilus assembly pilin Flp
MKRVRRFLRDERGSATTEGVIVAFFMAIVFGATIWVAQLFVASLGVGRDVRAQIDGPSYLGGESGEEDGARTRLFDPARTLTERWVPLRAQALSSIRKDRVRGQRSTTVQAPAPIGGGSADLRWTGSRQRNEVPRAGSDGNWPAMLDTFCRTGMCE